MGFAIFARKEVFPSQFSFIYLIFSAEACWSFIIEENVLISSEGDDRKDTNCGDADQLFELKPLGRQSEAVTVVSRLPLIAYITKLIILTTWKAHVLTAMIMWKKKGEKKNQPHLSFRLCLYFHSQERTTFS